MHLRLDSSDLYKFWSHGSCAKAAKVMTLLENCLFTLTKTVSPFCQLIGKGMKSIVSLPHKFCKMCVVKTPEKIMAKTKNQGEQCIWVGYAARHAVGTLINPPTKRCIL